MSGRCTPSSSWGVSRVSLLNGGSRKRLSESHLHCCGMTVSLRHPPEWASAVAAVPFELAPAAAVTAKRVLLEIGPDNGPPPALARRCGGAKLERATEGSGVVYLTPEGLWFRAPEPRVSVLRRLVAALFLTELLGAGYHCLHAGAFTLAERLVLVAGHSKSGKSTLVRAIDDQLGSGLGDNYALLDRACRWTPFLAGDKWALRPDTPPPSLALVLVLRPGARAPCLTREAASVLVDYSVSLHFADLFACVDGAPPSRVALPSPEALAGAHRFVARLPVEVWAFHFRPGIDDVATCRASILDHTRGRITHAS